MYDLCCKSYPACLCALDEQVEREHAARTRRRVVNAVLVVLFVVGALAFLVGCGPRDDPPRPTDEPSVMYTVIVPNGAASPDGIFDNN